MQTVFRAVIGLCAIGIILVYAAGRDVASLPSPHGAVTFTDRTGDPLGTILSSGSADAVGVPLDRVSPAFLDAIVSAEDGRFYEHGAIDARSLVRATEEWFVYGRSRSGGSTIAMQLARLLHPDANSLRGKLRQIVDAERIAIRSEKPAILAAYVNRVPMGGNVYGVEAAARTYYDEPASDLDLAHASLLAAVPNDPTRLAPDAHPAAARERQRYVLERMRLRGTIDALAERRAFEERAAAQPRDRGIADAAHALFYLYPQVRNRERVRTTIDRDLQRFVQGQTLAVLAALGNRHVTDAAVLVVENRTGNVLAYVGSPDYFSDADLGRNDGVQALRQPGSSLKPFTYELALERGTVLSTAILPDVPSSFSLPGGKLYQPADYSGSFSGPVRVRYALANSLNVPAVGVLSTLGTQPLLERLHDLGFAHLDRPASYYGLGLTLGGGEVSLWENVRAYVTMARSGRAIPLRLMDGESVAGARDVGDPAVWSLVTDMLADPHARAHSFGRRSVLDMPFDAAVKTGTSSDFRDTWTVGFSRDYTVGVWVGNFDGSAMRDVSGVTGAGPLWNRIMLHLHERSEPARFDPPRGYVRARICATTGHAPLRDCGAVVEEWVRPADLASVRRGIPVSLGREYDRWLATAPNAVASGPLRIVSPAAGSVFYHTMTRDALQRSEQQLALRSAGTSDAVAWYVDGRRLPLDAERHAFWPLALGTHTVEARSAHASDRVTFRVVPQPQQLHPGFTFTRLTQER